MIGQIASVTIFVLMFALIVSEKIAREWVSLGCGALMLIVVCGIIERSPREMWNIVYGVNWSTIIFIAGMMIMVEGMGRSGFFRWLCLYIAKAVHYKAVPILISFMIMSFALAMFIDSITVILFLAAVSVELAQLLGFSPVPLILSEVFCANLGGAATMCGDPPNIIIGTSLEYTFADFITNTGLMAIVSLTVTVLYFYLCFRKKLMSQNADNGITTYPLPHTAIKDKRRFTISCVIFGCAVVLLVTHAYTGLSVAEIGVFISVLTILTSGKEALSIIKKVDYRTLCFFVGLFVVVGGLETTGILELIASLIGRICGGNSYVMIAVILWISAIASAFIDNIPFAATMIPVIRSLAGSAGVSLDVLAWTLALGTDIGGSATPIGASANVVGVSISSKSGHLIGWKEYCKYMAPATVISITICMIGLYFKYL